MALLTLDEFKLSRFADIDKRTLEVLGKGFTYNGVAVSLSLQSQIRYESLVGLGSLLTSITIEAADPLQDPLVLPMLGNASAFATAARAYVKAIFDAETVMKSAIRAATSTAGVEAVVDTRQV